ncbi:MAG TPA: tetratricopeptide repeat-containing diguanylate cyclase [Burkholderiaceae bacterium]
MKHVVRRFASDMGCAVHAAVRATLCASLALTTISATAAEQASAAASPSAGAAPASIAQAVAGSPAATELWREFDQIERGARARPVEYLSRLARLEARTRAGSPERMELLSLRGLLGSLAPDRLVVEQAETELKVWPDPKMAEVAQLVPLAAWARLQREHGDLREAHRVLAAIPAAALAQMPLAMQWRHQIAVATVESDVGNLDAAIVAGHAALKIAEAMTSGWRRTISLSYLASDYQRSQQFERAKATAEEARASAAADPESDDVTLNQMHRAIGIAYSYEPDGKMTQRAFESAVEYSRKIGAAGILALDLSNLADCHLRRGNYAQALALTEQALPLARSVHQRSAEIGALHNSGLAKIALHRVAEGREDVRRAITMDEQQGAMANAADSWLELGNALEAAGDWAGAIEADHRHRELMDRVMREDSRKTVLEVQERYDAEQRAKDITLLNRDNNLKSEQLRTRELELRLWGAVGGCVVLAAALVALAYQRVRKTNSALATTNEDLKLQSERDPLTGLANRRHFQAVVKRLAEKGQFAGTVFLIDIDHFKRINDRFGHAGGDAVLIEVARRLRAALREEDLVVRWGGEEFLIVIESRDAAHIQHLAQRLLNHIATPRIQHGNDFIPVTASIGFGTFPIEPNELNVSWERAIDLVDTVMFIAKAHGRNKAYGVEHVQAHSETDLALLATRLESAWREGMVGLHALQGPAAESRL